MRVSAKGAKAAVTAGLVSALVLGGIAPATPAIAASVTVTTGSQAYQIKGEYKVYQLFTGSFDASGAHMGNVEANDAYKAAVVSVLTDNFGFTLYTDYSEDRQAIQITDAIHDLKANPAQARLFANKLAGALDGLNETKKVTPDADGQLKVSDLDTGYYLIVGTDTANALTSAIVVPVNGDNVSATIKTSTPTITKQVKMGTDADFADFTDGGLTKSGKLDSITYKLVGTVSSNIEDFSEYKYVFEDNLPNGITKTSADNWHVSVQATIGGQTKKLTGFTAANDGGKVTWTNTDLLQSLKTAGFTQDFGKAQITLTYMPDFTPDELVGALQTQDDATDTVKHATNTAKLIYSNNPYGNQTGETSSASTSAKVYSYQLDLTSVADDISIAGAKFKLMLGDEVIDERTVDEDGKLSMPGLDSGVEYTLIESGVPAGTMSVDPIKFTITAEKDTAKVTKVTATETADPSGAATFGDENDTDNIVHVTVKSLAGADLPLTGQQGIVAGVTVGGIVLAVSLVTAVRNRKNNE